MARMPVGLLVSAVCVSQILAQIGAFSVPALLPVLMADWALSNTDAGWVTGIFYAGYAVSVPVLVSLTDRVDPKRIYLLGVGLITLSTAGFAWFAEDFYTACVFRALWGIGWAGTYMPGLKALSDIVEGPQQSRAVSAHAASVGVSGAFSFLIAETIGSAYGWQWGIGAGAVGSGLAFLIALFVLPRRKPRDRGDNPGRLLDFRPVLRNTSALAYSIGYLVHTWEMSALRSWVVTFLTFAALHGGSGAGLITPAMVAMCLGLVGTATSVMGNEAARRFGRARYITFIMLVSILAAGGVGFSSGGSYGLAAAACLIYAGLIWADSSSLTAGTVGSADPARRGATMAVHSTLGYFGGFLGPLVLGLVLDLYGEQSPQAWGIAFMHLSVVVLVGLIILRVLKPTDLAGDRARAR